MKCFFRLFVALFLFTCSANLATAQNEIKISVQGILRDMNGTPVDDGEQELVFRLYDQPTGGTALWADTAVVEISGGVYSYNLGSDVPLDPAQFSSTLYVGVSVEGFELEPRTELTYAPYTLFTNSATRADTAAFATEALNIIPNDSLEVVEELRMLRGWVDQNGNIFDGTGFTVNKSGTGQYQISFDESFSGWVTPYVVPVASTQCFTAVTGGWSVGGMSVFGYTCGSSSTLTDVAFQFIVIGPR